MFIENTPVDNLQKIKMKRESLGLSHDDVFKKIRIRASYLKDIENGEFHLLPDPVYTKNFIKTYAKFLGVDEKPIMKDYDAFINARKEELAPPPEPSPEEKNFFAAVSGKKNYWSLFFVLIIISLVWLVLRLKSPEPEEINPTSKITAPAAPITEQKVNPSPNVTLTVNQPLINNSGQKAGEMGKGTPGNTLGQLASANVTVQKNALPPSETRQVVSGSEQKNSLPKVNKVEQGTAGNVLGPSANKDIKKNVSLPPETKQVASSNAQKSNLFIVASQETWVRVKSGENPPIQILLKPGDKFENSGETFNLDIGNAGGIKIRYKGKNIENIGEAGEVVHIKLPQ